MVKKVTFKGPRPPVNNNCIGKTGALGQPVQTYFSLDDIRHMAPRERPFGIYGLPLWRHGMEDTDIDPEVSYNSQYGSNTYPVFNNTAVNNNMANNTNTAFAVNSANNHNNHNIIYNYNMIIKFNIFKNNMANNNNMAMTPALNTTQVGANSAPALLRPNQGLLSCFYYSQFRAYDPYASDNFASSASASAPALAPPAAADNLRRPGQSAKRSRNRFEAGELQEAVPSVKRRRQRQAGKVDYKVPEPESHVALPKLEDDSLNKVDGDNFHDNIDNNNNNNDDDDDDADAVESHLSEEQQDASVATSAGLYKIGDLSEKERHGFELLFKYTYGPFSKPPDSDEA